MWIRINVLLWCRNCSEAFPVWTEALSVTQFATLPFDLKRLFFKTRFCCNFCSDKSVHTWFGPFQKPIRYGTFHFQQRSGAVLFRSRNCFESSVPSVNRSPIRYTFCDAPFHYPVQCEHSLKIKDNCQRLNGACLSFWVFRPRALVSGQGVRNGLSKLARGKAASWATLKMSILKNRYTARWSNGMCLNFLNFFQCERLLLN